MSARRAKVLIVDDEEGAREALELILEDHFEVESVSDGRLALEKLEGEFFDLVLLDITMPEVSGIEVLQRIRKLNDSIDVIMVSGADRAREATVCMKSGAFDYITKPFDPDAILSTIEGALKRRSAMRPLRSERVFTFGKVRIVSQSPSMYSVFRMIEKTACTSSNVLIIGESGTGKELIARAIHARSHRADGPFVALNCAAIPPELMENELFGHEKGAFTGADTRTMGKFESAHGGTIFLDEISCLELHFQPKLLRVLQEREFCRVGGHQVVSTDARVVAATNTRLDQMVKQNQFRSDLFFRLNVIPVELPPLRHRKGDMPMLARFFLEKFNRLMGKGVKGIAPEAMELLEAYPWPGNVRELENLIERLVVLSRSDEWIDEMDLPFDLLTGGGMSEASCHIQEAGLGLIEARLAFERRYIMRALERCRWNQTDTARRLKIHRNTLLQRMKALDIKGTPALGDTGQGV